MADDATELPDQLRALGAGFTAVVPADLADRVLSVTATAPLRHHVPWRRWAAALAALLVGLGVSIGISAPVRAAFVDVLKFGGIEIRVARGPSPVLDPTLPGEHPTDIIGAALQVGFRVRVPSALGPPDAVTVADGRVVSLHYTRTTPPLRIDEFNGDLGLMWEKFALGPAQRTSVDGRDALWFEDPVTLVYVDSTGLEQTESPRMTDGTLVWRDGGLTFRLDGVRPLSAALIVARSMS
jgi:hypothetical protein